MLKVAKKLSSTLLLMSLVVIAHAQSKPKVLVKQDPTQQKVVIEINGKPFTDFIFTDTMEKPFLYPIYAPDGQLITRGFPWHPQPNDPTDPNTIHNPHNFK